MYNFSFYNFIINLKMNSKKPSTKLPQKEKTQVHKIEKIGYKVANKVHKFAVLSMVSFIIFNIFLFGKQYNDHWRARRVKRHFLILLIF